MGSRKESLKKSLGISEYPWSSDEEDSSALQPVQVVRRQSDEPRPSVADMPGTSTASGSQQTPSSPATVRKQQAKMDRALFWSIINNTPRPSNTPVTRPRLCEVPLTMLSPPSGPPRSEVREPRRSDRPSTSATDIRRILAFKKLTRSLHNLTYKGPSNTHPATRRLAVSVGSSRSPLFTPSLPSDAASNPRTRATSSRSQLPRSSMRYPHRNYASGYHLDILPEQAISGRCRAPRPGVASDIDTSLPAPEPHHYVNVDQSDDDVEAVSETPATAEQNDDNNAEEEHAETPTHDASAGAISLEEEIVEVDAPDEPDTAPTVDVESDAPEPHISNENNAAATTSDENAESAQPQSPFHGIKRKRERY